MKNSPATMTSSTIATLMATMTDVDLRGDLDAEADDAGEDQHDRGGDQVVALAVDRARAS